MKKKYYVFPQLAFVVIALSILEIVAIILCATLVPVSNGQDIIIYVVLFVSILSVTQIVMIICIMWAQICFDENGVTKYLFGKQIKFFSWDEICEIKWLNNNNSIWVVFCTKLVPDEKLYFCNRKSYTIAIYKRKVVIDAILKYCPEGKSIT